jgi:hypothetical protein
LGATVPRIRVVLFSVDPVRHKHNANISNSDNMRDEDDDADQSSFG